RINVAERVDQARVDGAPRYLVRRLPAPVVALQRNLAAGTGDFAGIAEVELVLLEILLEQPRPAVARRIERGRDGAARNVEAACGKAAVVVVASCCGADDGVFEPVVIPEVHAACRG